MTPGCTGSRSFAAIAVEIERAGQSVDHRHAVEQRARGDGSQHEVLHGRLGRDAGVAIEGHHRVHRQRQQLHAQVHREQAVGRDQHEDAEQRRERQHVVLAAQDVACLQVGARVQQRHGATTSKAASFSTTASSSATYIPCSSTVRCGHVPVADRQRRAHRQRQQRQRRGEPAAPLAGEHSDQQDRADRARPARSPASRAAGWSTTGTTAGMSASLEPGW